VNTVFFASQLFHTPRIFSDERAVGRSGGADRTGDGDGDAGNRHGEKAVLKVIIAAAATSMASTEFRRQLFAVVLFFGQP